MLQKHVHSFLVALKTGQQQEPTAAHNAACLTHWPLQAATLNLQQRQCKCTTCQRSPFVIARVHAAASAPLLKHTHMLSSILAVMRCVSWIHTTLQVYTHAEASLMWVQHSRDLAHVFTTVALGPLVP